MSETEKGPGDIQYPKGQPKNLKKMPDGNPYPYEFSNEADSGVIDDNVADKFNPESGYTPKSQENEGDSGLGGSGK